MKSVVMLVLALAVLGALFFVTKWFFTRLKKIQDDFWAGKKEDRKWFD